jgi:4-hydroxybenzoate polyprenyltransferase
VFWGNLVVSVSSSLVILMVWLFEFMFLREAPDNFVRAMSVMPAISAFMWSYALFAFLVSLIREFIKDCQDMAGDQRFGSYSLAIAMGIPAMKIIIVAGTILSMALLATGQFYLWKYGYRFGFWFLMLTVQFMFVYLLINVIRARKADDFSAPSQLAKFIMLAGVLSMQLIYLDIT